MGYLTDKRRETNVGKFTLSKNVYRNDLNRKSNEYTVQDFQETKNVPKESEIVLTSYICLYHGSFFCIE